MNQSIKQRKNDNVDICKCQFVWCISRNTWFPQTPSTYLHTSTRNFKTKTEIPSWFEYKTKNPRGRCIVAKCFRISFAFPHSPHVLRAVKNLTFFKRIISSARKHVLLLNTVLYRVGPLQLSSIPMKSGLDCVLIPGLVRYWVQNSFMMRKSHIDEIRWNS